MPFCPQCGFKIEPALGAVCTNGHRYIPADEEAVSLSAEQLERDFVDTFYLMKHHTPLMEAADLLRQAAHCCKSKDYDASALVCRAALECALFKTRIMKADFQRTYFVEPAILDLLPNIQFTFGRLLKWARDVGLLKNELVQKAIQVRELGNFVAHLGERRFREAIALVKDSESAKSYRLWISPEEAYWSLSAVKQAILHMATHFPI